MYFSKEALKNMQKEFESVDSKFNTLREAYIIRDYNNARAKEYAAQGFSRRFATLTRCMENVFEILPPDRTELPQKNELRDATINIQAFVFNVFGSIDNLAWIWVSEKELKGDDGARIPNSYVGLGKKNELVRNSFSADFREYLEKTDKWFEYLEDYRHALAHRIPLYVPPYSVPEQDAEKYHELEALSDEAMKLGDDEEQERLLAEQEKLCKFIPCITHSFEESAKPVDFHPQMLVDFNTVDELGRKMLEELNR